MKQQMMSAFLSEYGEMSVTANDENRATLLRLLDYGFLDWDSEEGIDFFWARPGLSADDVSLLRAELEALED